MTDAQVFFALVTFVLCTYGIEKALRVYRDPEGTFVAFWGWILGATFAGLLASAAVLA